MSRTRRSRAAAEQVGHGGTVAATGANRAVLFNRIVNLLPIIEYAADSLATLLPFAHINTAFHDAMLHHCPADFWRRIALTMKPRGSSHRNLDSVANVDEQDAPLRLLWNLAHHDKGDAFEAVLARCTRCETRLMFTSMRAAGFKFKNSVLESLLLSLYEYSYEHLKDLDVSCIEYTYSAEEQPAIFEALMKSSWDEEPLLVRRLATAPCYGAEAVMWRNKRGDHIGTLLLNELDEDDGGEDRAVKTALRIAFEDCADENDFHSDALREKESAEIDKQIMLLRRRRFAQVSCYLAIVATRLSEQQCGELFSDPKFVKYAKRNHFVPGKDHNILAEVLKQRAELLQQQQQAEAPRSG